MKQSKRISAWLEKNTADCTKKTIAVTGSTGGLGRALCRTLASLGASLILVDRDPTRSEQHRDALLAEFPHASIRTVIADMEDITSVRAAAELLRSEPLDALILNAGAYSIPRHTSSTGYDNVYTINFISPYYLARTLLPTLEQRNGTVVAVGSIAHTYGRTDARDVDFATRKKASQVYGNAKRYLMFSLYALFREVRGVSLAVTHPGISFTGITAHYPRLIFALIKHPMKIIFMKPGKACLSIVRGVFEPCGRNEWIGPRIFDVWGYPKKKPLRTVTDEEAALIASTAEHIFGQITVPADHSSSHRNG